MWNISGLHGKGLAEREENSTLLTQNSMFLTQNSTLLTQNSTLLTLTCNLIWWLALNAVPRGISAILQIQVRG